MAGRPRTRRAESLALGIAIDLRDHGPATIAELLDRRMCGPSAWGQMAQWEQAASRMAIRILHERYGARLDVDGRLYLPPRQRRTAA